MLPVKSQFRSEEENILLDYLPVTFEKSAFGSSYVASLHTPNTSTMNDTAP
jgi:hypothetical protein